MSSVLKEWVTKMPWKCQSILLSGLLFHFAPESDARFIERHQDKVERE